MLRFVSTFYIVFIFQYNVIYVECTLMKPFLRLRNITVEQPLVTKSLSGDLLTSCVYQIYPEIISKKTKGVTLRILS